MSKKGRPRKVPSGSLYSVKKWIEYTSDTDSDNDNIRQNGRFEPPDQQPRINPPRAGQPHRCGTPNRQPRINPPRAGQPHRRGTPNRQPRINPPRAGQPHRRGTPTRQPDPPRAAQPDVQPNVDGTPIQQPDPPRAAHPDQDEPRNALIPYIDPFEVTNLQTLM